MIVSALATVVLASTKLYELENPPSHAELTGDDLKGYCGIKSFPHPKDKNCSVLFAYMHECTEVNSNHETSINIVTVCGPTAEVVTDNRAVAGTSNKIDSDSENACIYDGSGCFIGVSSSFNPQNLIVGVGMDSTKTRATICYDLENVGEAPTARDAYCEGEDSQPELQWESVVHTPSAQRLEFNKCNGLACFQIFLQGGDLPEGIVPYALDILAKETELAFIRENSDNEEYQLCVVPLDIEPSNARVDTNQQVCINLADKLDCHYRESEGSGYTDSQLAPTSSVCSTGYTVKFSADKTYIVVGLLPDGTLPRSSVSDDYVIFQRFKLTFDESKAVTGTTLATAEAQTTDANDVDLPYSNVLPGQGRRRRSRGKTLSLASVNVDLKQTEFNILNDLGQWAFAHQVCFGSIMMTPDSAVIAFYANFGGTNFVLFKRIGSDKTCTFKTDTSCSKATLLRHEDSYVVFCPYETPSVYDISKGDALVEYDVDNETPTSNVCRFPVTMQRHTYFSRPAPVA